LMATVQRQQMLEQLYILRSDDDNLYGISNGDCVHRC
jgi:hypothetical protein